MSGYLECQLLVDMVQEGDLTGAVELSSVKEGVSYVSGAESWLTY